MSRIVDVEQLGCLAWKDGEHGTTFDDGVLWVLEKIDELPTMNACNLIYRQDAIDAIEESRRLNHHQNGRAACAHEYEHRHFLKILRELPSVQPQQWIPCSGRLPTERDWYLGIFKEPDTGWINPVPFICDYVGKETTATTKECWILKDCTDREEHIDYYFNLKCVAWMPLPKLYSDNM